MTQPDGGRGALRPPSSPVAPRARREPGPRVDVLFAVVPFLPEHQPALGVSSLAAVLARHGLRATIRYFNVATCLAVGEPLYVYVSRDLPAEVLLGEMLFARALWGDAAASWDDYVARLEAELPTLERVELDGRAGADAARERRDAWHRYAPRLRELHEAAPAVVAGWADAILAARPRVVGLTTTFQQNVAALALARAVKSRASGAAPLVLLGGANCEDDMGRALAESFPWVDHVVSGEGEEVAVELVRSAVVEGPHRRAPRYVEAPRVARMDELPLPEFDDYFAAVRDTALERSATLGVESARGCWWGAKSHCTFCGLNGAGMAFRSKDPARFADELRALAARHGVRTFMVADNILDMRYVRELFPELGANDDGLRLFYETKSNLRQDQLEIMAAGGVFMIQPGIESLDSRVLALMGKGSTRLQNVALLKWAGELGITVLWNLLHGFPGEPAAAYRDMAALVPALVHLPPPIGVMRIRIDRFSPYWSRPEAYGVSGLRRYWAYDHAYAPLCAATRERLAYFFTGSSPRSRELDAAVASLTAAVERWKAAHATGAALELRTTPAGPVVADGRDGDAPAVTAVPPLERALLDRLDGGARRERVSRAVAGATGASAAEVDAALARCVARRWVVEEGERMISVVTDPDRRHAPSRRRMNWMLERQGVRLPAPLADLQWVGAARGGAEPTHPPTDPSVPVDPERAGWP